MNKYTSTEKKLQCKICRMYISFMKIENFKVKACIVQKGWIIAIRTDLDPDFYFQSGTFEKKVFFLNLLLFDL
jgi:hypothetical protein